MKFEEFGFNEHIMKAIKELGYEDPTLIQEKSIPIVAAGKDVVAQSSTGSGKTAAFGLPVLEKLEPGKGIQMLILTPTRELCVQDKEAIEQFAKYLHIHVIAVYGGVGYEPQIHGMRTADVVCATPGRMLDHIRQGNINLKNVKWLVLDEADKMFEMGFIDDVEHIIGQTSKDRQTLLFSATFPSEIHRLVEKYMRNPVDIKAEIYVLKTKLKQIYYTVDQRDKFSLLVHHLKSKKQGKQGLAMVFCATRDEVSLLTKNLEGQGISVLSIHGGLAQSKRLQALEQLKHKDIDVLVATDVAARGLDIKDVTHIYNYDVPKTSIEYIHRIGRTARAGAAGEAVTLLSQRDFENFERVLEDRSLDLVQLPVPQMERLQFHLMRPGREMRGGREGSGSRYEGAGERGPRSYSPRREGGFSRDGGESPRGGSSDTRSGGYSRGPRPSGPRGPGGYSHGPRSEGSSGSRPGGYSRGPSRDLGGSSRGGSDSGSGFVEISGGFGEKPKLVRISDAVSGHPGHDHSHAPSHASPHSGHPAHQGDDRRDGRRDFPKKPGFRK